MKRSKTFDLLESTSKSATFNMDDVDIAHADGFSLSVTTSAQSSLNCTIAVYGSAGDNDNFVIHGSAATVTTNTTTMFNIADAFYKQIRVVVTFTAGSATFEAECTVKGN